jgi:hypothetical protein
MRLVLILALVVGGVHTARIVAKLALVLLRELACELHDLVHASRLAFDEIRIGCSAVAAEIRLFVRPRRCVDEASSVVIRGTGAADDVTEGL